MTNEELDRKMAENVMGWRGYGDWWETQDLKDQIMKMSEWQPTRRIEQAMIVLEKFPPDNWYFGLSHLKDGWHSALWGWPQPGNLREGWGIAEKPAEAICRAVEAAWGR